MKKYVLISVELGPEFESDSIIAIYDEQKRLKQDDKDHHDMKSYYVEKIIPIKDTNDVNAIEGKVYKRKNKYFFKPL